MNTTISYRIFPLGDAAITIDYGNNISESVNKEVVARFQQMRSHPLSGMVEAVPAYSSLTVYYDVPVLRKIIPVNVTVFEWMKKQLEERLQKPLPENIAETRLIRIPVCYEKEFAPDIRELAGAKNISVEEVIRLHLSGSYRVYMLGFLPGFVYLGEVDDQIAMPRKPQPQPVWAGSVGIAGKQTGIYPLASPGGWQIIGRTPWRLFDANKAEPTLLRAGDTVQFYSISKNEFEGF